MLESITQWAANTPTNGDVLMIVYWVASVSLFVIDMAISRIARR